MSVFTKTGIALKGYFVSQRVKDGKTEWHIFVGYTVQTQEGDEFQKDGEIELTKTMETKAASLYNDVIGRLVTKENI